MAQTNEYKGKFGNPKLVEKPKLKINLKTKVAVSSREELEEEMTLIRNKKKDKKHMPTPPSKPPRHTRYLNAGPFRGKKPDEEEEEEDEGNDGKGVGGIDEDEEEEKEDDEGNDGKSVYHDDEEIVEEQAKPSRQKDRKPVAESARHIPPQHFQLEESKRRT
ncbi:nucleolin-like [Papaver somniferum]|uniref:nucleolin-like n=1 Tax=Papaver somniferum TaxID=3469 RepID=UPI000E6FC3DD|nr:nucleolin-like [Papaver somniferum]